MGGRSATSGIETFGRKTGTRLLPVQYKGAVSDQANFILRELQQNPATQNIVRRSFKGNTATVVFDISGGGFKATRSFVEELGRLETEYLNRIEKQKKRKKDTNTWSAYDVERAKMQATKQALEELQKLRKKIK